MPARFVPPGPEILDARGAGGRDRRFEVGKVVARQPEARQPELGADAVSCRGLGEQRGEATDERLRGLVEVLPVRIRCEDVEAGQRGDRVPVTHPVWPFDEREEADRVLATAPRDVRRHLAQEVDDGVFTETFHFWYIQGQTLEIQA